MHVEVEHTIDGARIDQLLELYASTWWTAQRRRADVERMLAGTGEQRQ